MEKISVKSVMLYIIRKYQWLIAAAVIGMVCLSGLNVMKGQNYVEHVTDTDTTTREDLEEAQDSR